MLPGDVESTADSSQVAIHDRRRPAEELAALRPVATLVARDSSAEEVLAKVVEEMGLLLRVEVAVIHRFEADGGATVVASWGDVRDAFPVGRRSKPDGDSATAMVYRTREPARVDDYETATGSIGVRARKVGIRSGVASPIVVNGRLWGAIAAGTTRPEPLPADAESRTAGFAELAATAIANVQARAKIQRLAEEQAALRRVATMIAQGHPPAEVFATVAEEVGQVLGASTASIQRLEPEGSMTVVGIWAKLGDVEAGVAGSRQAAVGSSVGSPIFVDGRMWGVIELATSEDEPMPEDAESRLAQFAELVAMAVANLQARAEVQRLAEEQAALRRVATLVARERPPDEVFATVAEEVGRVGGAESAVIHRFDPDGNSTIVASYGPLEEAFWVGSRWSLEGKSVAAEVYRTGQPARFDNYAAAAGSIGTTAQQLGIRSGVSSPIVVNGRLWGAIAAGTTRPRPLPADAEPRMAEFTELAATAIANVQARSDLAASRARIIATADEERTRVVRDLHDGAQARLVHTVLTLEIAALTLEQDRHDAAPLVQEALKHAQTATSELRELAHGILPSVLTHGGLRAGVEALVPRMSIPVEIDIAVDRLSPAVEATAYFVVAEALTNVAKHSKADRATVSARVEDDRTLELEVRDNGVGGARPQGTGLVGLSDRLAVFEGSLRVESPPEGGTLLAASIPIR